MNRLDTQFDGGVEFFLDDYRWGSEAFQNAFDNLLKDFAIGTNENFIISGVVATINAGVNATVTSGYIYLNGEILQVDAQSVLRTVGTDLYSFSKVTTTDTAGDRLTKNTGINISPYEKNRGVVSNVSSVATSALSIDGDRFKDKIVQKIAATDAEAQALTLDTVFITPSNLNSISATTTQKGILATASGSEAQAGTIATKAITPSTLSARTATETRTGILEIATATETQAGTLDDKIVTPLKLRTQETWNNLTLDAGWL